MPVSLHAISVFITLVTMLHCVTPALFQTFSMQLMHEQPGWPLSPSPLALHAWHCFAYSCIHCVMLLQHSRSPNSAIAQPLPLPAFPSLFSPLVPSSSSGKGCLLPFAFWSHLCSGRMADSLPLAFVGHVSERQHTAGMPSGWRSWRASCLTPQSSPPLLTATRFRHCWDP